MRNQIVISLALVAALSLGITACGSDPAGAPAGAEDPIVVTTTSSTTTTEAGPSPEEIQAFADTVLWSETVLWNNTVAWQNAVAWNEASAAYEAQVAREAAERAEREAAAAAAVEPEPESSPAPTERDEPAERPAPAAEPAAPSGGVWDALAQCESGGNWSINTGNGFYGGLQFTVSSWRAVGGSGMPHQASRGTQIAMGQRLQAIQGWGAWPACAAKLGLR